MPGRHGHGNDAQVTEFSWGDEPPRVDIVDVADAPAALVARANPNGVPPA